MLVSPFYNDMDEDTIVQEINDTIRAIEMVLRCSVESIAIVFNRIGSELLPLLIGEIQEQLGVHGNCRPLTPDGSDCEKALSRNANEDSEDYGISSKYPSATVDRRHKTSSHLLKSCTKIIAHFARVGSLTEKLATSKGLLSTLQYVVSNAGGTVVAPVEARLNCLWTLANLACSAENMITIASDSDLLNTLIEVASHPNKDDEENAEGVMQYIELLKIRSVALRAIFNLSWANENKVFFSEDLRLVELLLSTAAHRSSKWMGHGKGVSSILLQSRRYSAGTLRNLAAAPRRIKKHLCQLRSGKFLDEIAYIAKDSDQYVRDKVHTTLWNLVSADTAKLYTSKKDVLDIIAQEAMTTGSVEKRNDSSHIMAARTLRSLEKTIPEDEEGYNILWPILRRFETKRESDCS